MHKVDPKSEECVVWAIRFFAGREPVDKREIEFHKAHETFESLRRAFCQIVEFEEYFHRVKLKGKNFLVPAFLLPAGDDHTHGGKVRHKFKFPTLNDRCCQLCTSNQLKEKSYIEWCEIMAIAPAMHRKQWEFVWILQTMKSLKLLKKGTRALGFGTGREQIPAVLAKYGVLVTASDAPMVIDVSQGWSSSNQHSQGTDDLFYPKIVARNVFDAHVSWAPIDMNAIPNEYSEYDVCWSACAFEHLGSLEAGLSFVRNSLLTLRVGGYSIHTTEFNLTSNSHTIESPGLSIFRKTDIERLADSLVAEGHEVWPLNFHPGSESLDEVIDIPPYGLPHLKLAVGKYTCTSIGIVVRRGI